MAHIVNVFVHPLTANLARQNGDTQGGVCPTENICWRSNAAIIVAEVLVDVIKLTAQRCFLFFISTHNPVDFFAGDCIVDDDDIKNKMAKKE